ncbi:hypothetical protein L2E82_12313 [Cichorium intybus]|uniref:Uncharacterized protein n=1 Tax=Cichorium intybus TaxID=13427 RepID=A0ACB9GFK7_CICIN|nr:hypothetical protein L2E82_12313 [Cichorium intybus]
MEASGTCIECFPSISLHLGFEKGGREETNHRKNQNSRSSHTSRLPFSSSWRKTRWNPKSTSISHSYWKLQC